ncbi:hypothetical protein ACI2K4_02185 [Micromonospora sp. NPDC050397]|uniref:hypothetical protein n=1 Tax=Micromonospora sp. NPDC050397 TaxID=3364279 RepID=UPI00384B9C92
MPSTPSQNPQQPSYDRQILERLRRPIPDPQMTRDREQLERSQTSERLDLFNRQYKEMRDMHADHEFARRDPPAQDMDPQTRDEMLDGEALEKFGRDDQQVEQQEAAHGRQQEEFLRRAAMGAEQREELLARGLPTAMAKVVSGLRQAYSEEHQRRSAAATLTSGHTTVAGRTGVARAGSGGPSHLPAAKQQSQATPTRRS